MSNPFVISTAAIHDSRSVIAFVDLSLLEENEGNGTIFLLEDGDLVPLYSIDREVLDIAISHDGESLFVLTHTVLFRFHGWERESEPQEVLSSENAGLLKKIAVGADAVYVVTMEDRILRIDPQSAKFDVVDCKMEDSDGVERLSIQDGVLKYAVGLHGLLLTFANGQCREVAVPTNKILNAVAETDANELVVVGQAGMFLKGALDALEVIDHDWEGYDLWDVTVCGERIFLLSEIGVFELNAENEVLPVVGREQKKSIFFTFKRSGSRLWAVGERHILEFDGKKWRDVFQLTA